MPHTRGGALVADDGPVAERENRRHAAAFEGRAGSARPRKHRDECGAGARPWTRRRCCGAPMPVQLASCAALTTPCCRAAILATTRSLLARSLRHTASKAPTPVPLPIHCRVRPLPLLSSPAVRRPRPSSPVFRATGPLSSAPYPSRAMPASAQYSVTVRVELDARQEPLGKLTAQIAEAGGALQSVDLVPGAGPEGKRVREFTIDANSPSTGRRSSARSGRLAARGSSASPTAPSRCTRRARSSSTTSTR